MLLPTFLGNHDIQTDRPTNQPTNPNRPTTDHQTGRTDKKAFLADATYINYSQKNFFRCRNSIFIFFPHIHITYARHTQAAWGRRSFELVLSLVKMTITTFYSQDCTSIDKLDVNDVTTNTLFMVHISLICI